MMTPAIASALIIFIWTGWMLPVGIWWWVTAEARSEAWREDRVLEDEEDIPILRPLAALGRKRYGTATGRRIDATFFLVGGTAGLISALLTLLGVVAPNDFHGLMR